MRIAIDFCVDRNEVLLVSEVTDNTCMESCINFNASNAETITVHLVRNGENVETVLPVVGCSACFVLDDAMMRTAGEFTVYAEGKMQLRFIVSETIESGTEYKISLTDSGFYVRASVVDGPPGAVSWDEISGKPSTFPPSEHGHDAAELSGLSKVATSGNYNDLTNKPSTIPPSEHGHNAAEISGLSKVATSGDYNDLTNKPDAHSIPPATTETLGGVKIGSGLGVTSSGLVYLAPGTMRSELLLTAGTFAVGATVPFKIDPRNFHYTYGRVQYVGTAPAMVSGTNPVVLKLTSFTTASDNKSIILMTIVLETTNTDVLTATWKMKAIIRAEIKWQIYNSMERTDVAITFPETVQFSNVYGAYLLDTAVREE